MTTPKIAILLNIFLDLLKIESRDFLLDALKFLYCCFKSVLCVFLVASLPPMCLDSCKTLVFCISVLTETVIASTKSFLASIKFCYSSTNFTSGSTNLVSTPFLICRRQRPLKKLEQKKRSRTHGLKGLYKAVNDDNEIFDVDALAGEEVFVAEQSGNVVEEVVAVIDAASTIPVSAAIITDEVEQLRLDEELSSSYKLKKKKRKAFHEKTSTKLKLKSKKNWSNEEKARLFVHSKSKKKTFCKLREVDTFVNYMTKLVEESCTRRQKRDGEEFKKAIKQVTKKQKVDDVQETAEVDNDQEAAKIKELMEIVPNKEEVAIDAIPLAVKPPSIGRIVGIKRLLDDLRVTAAQVCVTAAKLKTMEEDIMRILLIIQMTHEDGKEVMMRFQRGSRGRILDVEEEEEDAHGYGLVSSIVPVVDLVPFVGDTEAYCGLMSLQPTPDHSGLGDIPEEDMPPRRRFVLTAPPPRYDVAESYAAAAARVPRGQYDFVNAVEAGQGLIHSPGHDTRTIARAADRSEDVGYVRRQESEIFYTQLHDARTDRRDIRLEIDVVRSLQRIAIETVLHEVLRGRARIDTMEDADSSC
ncbi:hypothetical protein Tco_0123632 [Tanacetum coccineum]